MDLITVMYLVVGVVIAFTVVLLLVMIAGKDIVMAFKRRFSPRGCDVFIANTNRNLSHYYLTPKDNTFRIDNLPYITNPEKTMNLTEVEKLKVVDSMMQREKRLNEKVVIMEQKVREINLMKGKAKDAGQINNLNAQIEHFKGIIAETKSKLRIKQENYFNNKRPAFFYIEGDPIPKDFYEWYSTLDAKMVDNLVSRAITQPPNKKTESDIEFMKMIIIGAGIAAVVAAFFAFRNNSILMEICKNAALKCGI